MMDPIISISTINDFLYCPRSLYMHMATGDILPSSYHQTPQVKGNELHASVDEKRYSNRKEILQSMNVYSEELQVQGKIDIFDTVKGELVERKTYIKEIYEGQLMQLYAQYFCLIEMKYKPVSLALYSMSDNKRYNIVLPGVKEKNRLKEIILQMQNYTKEDLMKHHCPNCENNIYAPLGW